MLPNASCNEVNKLNKCGISLFHIRKVKAINFHFNDFNEDDDGERESKRKRNKIVVKYKSLTQNPHFLCTSLINGGIY